MSFLFFLNDICQTALLYIFVCIAQTSVYSELDTHVYVHTFRLLLYTKGKKDIITLL